MMMISQSPLPASLPSRPEARRTNRPLPARRLRRGGYRRCGSVDRAGWPPVIGSRLVAFRTGRTALPGLAVEATRLATPGLIPAWDRLPFDHRHSFERLLVRRCG